jgi:hypothetical protein
MLWDKTLGIVSFGFEETHIALKRKLMSTRRHANSGASIITDHNDYS